MNAKQLVLLTIHEAVPGHYLQGTYANRVDRPGRLLERPVRRGMGGLRHPGDDGPGLPSRRSGLLLNHWKYYLRAVVNAIIDARIHTAGMTEEEAVSLMVDGGFQEEAEARAKYNRARLSSTQLSTYFVGSMEFW